MLEIIKQKYNIIRKIGQGGMAEIYLATEIGSTKKIAIKILNPNFQKDIIKMKRFEHEIEILKKVDSPYVAKMYDSEITSDYAYIVMDYVDGFILKNYINKYTRLTVDETIELTKQMALGFDEIHKSHIVHRDIKSQNIMIAQNGRIKIIDFGIAIDDDTERLTKTNMLIGSPQYVSPELIDQEEPTRHADIYALGVLMYEMLTGKVPFTGKNALETLRKHQSTPVPKITKSFPNVPQSIENIITKATAKKASQRYDTMYEMYLDLKSALNIERANEAPISINKKKKKSFVSMINSKLVLGLIVGTLLVITITLIVVFSLKGF